MSQENVDLIRAIYPSPDADVAALFRDDRAFEAMREALAPFLTDDFESTMAGGPLNPENATRAGLDGMRQNWIDWVEPWATYRSTIDELIDVGDRVLLLLRDYGRRTDMDAEVELIGASVCTFRDGKIARWEDYTDRAKALEAAGLSE